MGWDQGKVMATAAGFAAALLIVNVVASTVGIGDQAVSDFAVNWSYRVLMAASALAVLARALFLPAQRFAWTMIGLGLLAWSAGDIAYEIAVAGGGKIPYPGVWDLLYVSLYAFLLVGLRAMGGKANERSVIPPSLLVTLLGLATIWSWLVFGGVLEDASGDDAAVAVTAAYPLLDLLLLGSALVAVAARGWRLDRSWVALIIGLATLALGDMLYTAKVAAGTFEDGSLVEVFWPASAVTLAVASWLPAGITRHGVNSERFVPILTTAAAGVAAFVLAWDHFEPVDTITFVLAVATSLGALLQLGFLFVRKDEAETKATAAEALFTASTRAALDSVITFDRHGIIREWNDAATQTFGLRPDEAIGSQIGDLVCPPLSPPTVEKITAGINRRPTSGFGERFEVMATHARGGSFPVEVATTRVQEDPPIFTAFARDITEQRRREAENARLASIVRSSEDAIISKDLEGNITAWNSGAERLYGYSAAEAIGAPIRELIIPPERESEYRMIVKDVLEHGSTSLETQRLSESGNLLDVSLRAFPIRNLEGRVVGVSTSAHNITDRLRKQRHERREHERELWRGRVKEALDEDRLRFWGQPIVDVTTGETHHHELLLRMELDGRIVTPNLFLPHAETADLITGIDRWAIEEGTRIGRRSPVAINLSARSVSNPRLLDLVQRALDESGTNPADVIFEITETAAAENMEAASTLVSGLTGLGCGVALDDFGTGYGSFTYLKYLPVTQLKIDITFVRNLSRDPVDRRVANSIIAVADNFGMQTVAEGVEDAATMHLLREMGVGLVQGYHLGRPRPISPQGPIDAEAPVASLTPPSTPTVA